jgi:APA family basic amino acid/polyamine antiporter
MGSGIVGRIVIGTSSTPRGQLVRALTLVPAASIILSNVIGTGVFVKARVMTCNVGTPFLVLTVWAVAGVLTIAGALVYAELSAMMPRAGGEYNFLGAAYGRLCAFLFAWTRILASAISGAAIAILCTTFLNDLLAGSLPPWGRWFFPLAIVTVATALNVMSVRSSGWVAAALTAFKVSLIVGVAGGACAMAGGSWSHFAQSGAGGTCEGVPPGVRGGVAGFGAAMLGALWAYNGWNVIGYVGGEVKDPGRTLPRALIGGCALVMLLYMTANAAYFYVLPPHEVASVSTHTSVAREVVARFLGSGAASIMAAGLLLSAYGTLHTGTLCIARIPFALASDRLLPRWLSIVSTRGVPVPAVLLSGVTTAALTLSGSFDVLTDVYVFVLWVFYGLTCTAVIALRWRHPTVPRPFRVWGYPVVPVLFLIATAFLLVNTLMATPWRALAGLILIVLGLPVYAHYAPRAGRARSADWFAAAP